MLIVLSIHTQEVLVISATHCFFLFFWFRCLPYPVFHHGDSLWHSSALHGVCHWAIHSFRACACSRQNMSFVKRWVTLQAEGSSHVMGMDIWSIFIHFLCFLLLLEYVYKVLRMSRNCIYAFITNDQCFAHLKKKNR